MKVSDEVLSILDRSTVNGATLKLPPGQLSRDVYVAVNKVIEAAGGKWNRKAGAHVFTADAADVIEPILLTGEYRRTKQEFGQFDSPIPVVDLLIQRAELRPGMKVLEPSAGVGNIVAGVITALDSAANIWGYEIDPKRHAACLARHHRAFGSGGLGLGDFLEVTPNPVFDCVAMNPPFAKQADIDHVLHAAKFLAAGGRLVAVMSAAVKFRSNKKTANFCNFLDEHNGEIEDLPPGSFESSGTSVNAVIVTMELL